MDKQVFEAEIVDANNGQDAAYVIIPFDVAAVFGSKRPKIVALFDGRVTYQGVLSKWKTDYYFLLMRKDVRTALGKGVGDWVVVEVALDTAPRVVERPAMLVDALEKEATVKAFFDSLSYSCQREYVEHLTSAKREATKLRRLEKVMGLLRDNKKYLR